MFVAVGNPVARRNSAITSRPEKTALRTARVFCIGEDRACAPADTDRFFEGPRAVRIEGDARIGEARLESGCGFHLDRACKHAALQLEVAEAVTSLGRFCETDHLGRRQGRLVAQLDPVVALLPAAIGQRRLAPIADIEEVAEHFDGPPLHAVAEQRRDRHVEILPEQIEQSGLDGRHRVDRDAEIERLIAPAAGVARPEALAHRVEHRVAIADALSHNDVARFFERLADALAAWDLTNTCSAARVLQQHDVAREERTVRARKI
jgi:hypothetical protein